MTSALRISILWLVLVAQTCFAYAEARTIEWRDGTPKIEQAAVCVAFSELMSMERLVSDKAADIWDQRRAHSVAMIHKLAGLEGGASIKSSDIDILTDRARTLLITNLTAQPRKQILNLTARNTLVDIIGNVCPRVFTESDEKRISKQMLAGSCVFAETSSKPHASLSPYICEDEDVSLVIWNANLPNMPLSVLLEQTAKDERHSTKLTEKISALQELNDSLRQDLRAYRTTASQMADINLINKKLRANLGVIQAERDRLAATDQQFADLSSQIAALREQIDAQALDMAEMLSREKSLSSQVATMRTNLKDLTDNQTEIGARSMGARTAASEATIPAEVGTSSSGASTYAVIAGQTFSEVRQRIRNLVAVVELKSASLIGAIVKSMPAVGSFRHKVMLGNIGALACLLLVWLAIRIRRNHLSPQAAARGPDETVTDTEFLLEIERRMLDIRQRYNDGLVSKDVYVSETRALYNKVRDQ